LLRGFYRDVPGGRFGLAVGGCLSVIVRVHLDTGIHEPREIAQSKLRRMVIARRREESLQEAPSP
jgi:hypothetical protein